MIVMFSCKTFSQFLNGILPKNVRQVITRLCIFFNAICRKVIDPNSLVELENQAIIILCQVEMYFPHSFFDIMVHLIVHLVREIRICGPFFYVGCTQLSDA